MNKSEACKVLYQRAKELLASGKAKNPDEAHHLAMEELPEARRVYQDEPVVRGYAKPLAYAGDRVDLLAKMFVKHKAAPDYEHALRLVEVKEPKLWREYVLDQKGGGSDGKVRTYNERIC